MLLLAQSAAEHSNINHTELELGIEDVRMAMQDCGAIAPEKILEEQIYDGEEDTRGVDAFIEWAMGPENSEIRRIALEGSDEGKEDYLTGLLSKASSSFHADI
jgi:transcription initiation factor TFIID subunit 3